jgi:hypothetical protein
MGQRCRQLGSANLWLSTAASDRLKQQLMQVPVWEKLGRLQNYDYAHRELANQRDYRLLRTSVP